MTNVTGLTLEDQLEFNLNLKLYTLKQIIAVITFQSYTRKGEGRTILIINNVFNISIKTSQACADKPLILH
jgi:hypothetical protein